jgi:hypothetical protein
VGKVPIHYGGRTLERPRDATPDGARLIAHTHLIRMDPLAFFDPPTSYRSVPFWSWNDRLQPGRLREQAVEFHRAGHGGFFMHARGGLRTPYLSDEWFAAVAESVSAAAELGIEAWLYDENDWPSGSAGGRVASEDHRFRARALVCTVHDDSVPINEALLRATCVIDGSDARDVRPWRYGNRIEPGRRLVQCTPWIAPLGQQRLHGATFIDTLHPPAVRAFLRHTHDRYDAHVGSDFVTTIPGVFTDEPSFGFGRAIGPQLWSCAVPWTDNLPTLFRADHGYDLTPRLVSLFFDTDDAPAVRHDYWHTVARRFTDSWSRQVFEWCDQRGLKLVGHHNGEDSLVEQMRWSGGVMPNYRYYHIPGVDSLGRDTGEPLDGAAADGSIVGIKQLDSVVCQLGKERALGEAFGGGGQDLALRSRWWLTNWLAVLGVNFLTPHLSSYSLRGARKRDYPPTLSSHQPWWDYQRRYEDAAARLCYALSQGRRVVDVLVIHPINSARIAYTPANVSRVSALDRMLLRLTSGLLAMHTDFHFGDETMLAETASIEPGALVVGSQRYRTVIVPRLDTLASSTVELLERFAARKGHIVCIGDAPQLIDGRPARVATLPTGTVFIGDEFSDEVMAANVNDPASDERDDHATPGPIPVPTALRDALCRAHPARLSISGDGADRIWYHLRAIDDGRELLFLANVSEEHGAEVSLEWPGQGALERWDAVTGTTSAMSSDSSQGSTVRLRIDKTNQLLLVRHPSMPAVACVTEHNQHDVTTTTLTMNRSWAIERDDPNALIIDSCSMRTGTGPWRNTCRVFEIAERLRDASPNEPFAVRFEFEVDDIPSSCDAVIEGEHWTAQLNGADLPHSTDWWIDPSWHRHSMTELLRRGSNALTLTGKARDAGDLESLILLGEFGVPATFVGERTRSRGTTFERWRVAPRITALPLGNSGGGDLVGDGFPHFVGTVRLSQTVEVPMTSAIESVLLRIDAVNAATALVSINGQQAGQLSWEPFSIEIGHMLVAGSNDISIALVTSLRNLLGPFHTDRGDPTFVSPATFTHDTTDDCWLVPLGLGDVHLDIRSRIDGAGDHRSRSRRPDTAAEHRP